MQLTATKLFHAAVTYLWILLAGLTLLSWILADSFIPGADSDSQWPIIILILIAFFKVRVVVMHFMEVATAPIPLRATFEIWILTLCSAILLLYLGYFQLPA